MIEFDLLPEQEEDENEVKGSSGAGVVTPCGCYGDGLAYKSTKKKIDENSSE